MPHRLMASHRPSSSEGQISSCLDMCIPSNTTVWEDWKACLDTNRTRNGDNYTVDFAQLMTDARARTLWATSQHTAVLLEFRAWKRELHFSLGNALTNLPVHWRIQVVGGPSICTMARDLYPVETHVGKVVLTNLGYDIMEQKNISRVLTDLEFYKQLLGDTWLFFQYDSAICSSQRDLLPFFLEKNYGWWGAPWRHWNRLPYTGGNGGFSLRQRSFVTSILTLFPWTSNEADGNEDWYMCNKAADLLANRSAPHSPYLATASRKEAKQFSVEMVYHAAPFGVHQFWRELIVHDMKGLMTLFEACPEAWELLPADVLQTRPDWREALCERTNRAKEEDLETRRYWSNCTGREGVQ